MTDASRRGRNNRRKGQVGEREVCDLLGEAFGLNLHRQLGQERDSGTDVHVPGFRIEVKRRKAIAGLYAWLATADVGGGLPLVCMRGDGREWLVAMRLADWVSIAAPIVHHEKRVGTDGVEQPAPKPVKLNNPAADVGRVASGPFKPTTRN